MLKITTEADIRSCYKVLKQLRLHLQDEDSFVEQVHRQMDQGFELVACLDNKEVKAVIGFLFLEHLAWGKTLYIDDLITDSETRKKGYASLLLNFVLSIAKNKKCNQTHLDSGPQRHEAHRLYMNHGFKIIGHHFAIDLSI